MICILYYHDTFAITKKPTLTHYYSLNSILNVDFITFSANILFLFQEPMQDKTLHLAALVFSLNFVCMSDLALVTTCFVLGFDNESPVTAQCEILGFRYIISWYFGKRDISIDTKFQSVFWKTYFGVASWCCDQGFQRKATWQPANHSMSHPIWTQSQQG